MQAAPAMRPAGCVSTRPAEVGGPAGAPGERNRHGARPVRRGGMAGKEPVCGEHVG